MTRDFRGNAPARGHADDGVMYFVANDGPHGSETVAERRDRRGYDDGRGPRGRLGGRRRGLGGTGRERVYFDGHDATHGFEL